MITGTTYPTREQSCAKHGITYAQFYIARLDYWNGECHVCKEDEKLEQRAREIFAERKTECEKQVSAELAKYDEQQILEHAESELTADLEKWRAEFLPQYVAQTRAALHEQVRREVEFEFLEQIKEELRTEKASARATA